VENRTCLLQTEEVQKSFGTVEAVRGVTLQIAQGEFVAIMGRSGSGKSTLLNLIAGLERPTSGRILFQGREINTLGEEELAVWRRENIGLVFQSFHLIPTLSALENVAFPLYPLKMSADERRKRAGERLAQVGLAERADHLPSRLSGGEQQRVAIARALVNQPTLILADEPTGNLDSATGQEILALFRRLNAEAGVALLMITHDEKVAETTDRIVYMQDGRVTNGTRSI
jgi:ABC-type lipoprotein export system ATPase subunit